jgi:hypothetical protein
MKNLILQILKYWPGLDCRKEFLDQFIANLTGENNIYTEFFDKSKCIFVHTPKAAGTSISFAIYGNDPWHFNVKELRRINKRKYYDYFKFSFVRNPWARMFSTYNYSKKWIKKHPQTSIRFMKKYNTFEDFIINGLSIDLIEKHYFFWSYAKYLTFDKKKIEVDFYGRFENLIDDFNLLNSKLGTNYHLPKMNQSSKKDYRRYYSKKTIDKIYKLYKDDVNLFKYDFE